MKAIGKRQTTAKACKHIVIQVEKKAGQVTPSKACIVATRREQMACFHRRRDLPMPPLINKMEVVVGKAFFSQSHRIAPIQLKDLLQNTGKLCRGIGLCHKQAGT